MYMLRLKTQWRAGTAFTCRTQPFVRFSYQPNMPCLDGAVERRHDSHSSTRVFLQHVELFRDDSLSVGTYNRASRSVMIYERCGGESKAPLQGFCCVCSLLTRFYRQWSTAVAHDVCLEHMTDGQETLEEVLARSDMII